MYDDGNNDELIESSSEDLFEDTDQSSNADSELSSSTLKYWQEWQPKNHHVAKKPTSSSSKNVPQRLDEICGFITAKSFSYDQLIQHHQEIVNRRKKNLLKSSTFNHDEVVAESSIFENVAVEERRVQIPEKIFLLIIKHCFPKDEKDIQLYSCLANGTTVPFDSGEQIYKRGSVKNVMQIGYLINADVDRAPLDEMKPKPTKLGANEIFCSAKSSEIYHVTIRVDRQRITSTMCTCEQSNWCHHVVATCLYRIYKADQVKYRPTMVDSITELSNENLKKLYQFFVSKLPTTYITIAQNLIDDFRESESDISQAMGAPDPTDGDHKDIPIWSLDERLIHQKIRTILIKFIKPKSGVSCFSDIQMLNNEPQPPVACEYKIRHTVLKSKQPAALWNFFGIVSEMFKRQDENATNLLHMITADCLAVDQIIIWWYQAKLLESGKWHMQLKNNRALQPNSFIELLYQAAALFDEIVKLWKIAALNPKLNSFEKEKLTSLLQFYHRQAVNKIWDAINKPDPHYQIKMMVNSEGHPLNARTASFTAEYFPGFYSALVACQVDFHSSELRCVPTTATRFSQPSDASITCPNIPIVRNQEEDFSDEIKSLSVTTAILWENSNAPEPCSSKKQKSKKKKRRSRTNHPNRQVVSNQNSGSGSAGTVDYSGGEDSLQDEYVENDTERKEKHELELDEFLALTHADQEPFNVRFDACNSLAHHGYPAEAAFMAFKLAKDILQNVPNVFYDGMAYENRPIECATGIDEGASSSGMKKSKPTMFSGILLVRQMESCPQKVEVQLPRQLALAKTRAAVEFLERSLELMAILVCLTFNDTEKYEVNGQKITAQDAHKLALEIGTTALSLQRYAAPTHQLEVYLNYLEEEILEALRAVKLTNNDTIFLRKLAMSTINRCKQSNNTDILPPTFLALFIVEALTSNGKMVKQQGDVLKRNTSDDEIGYQVALNCLDIKLSYVEEDYPMLFECFRKHCRALIFALIIQFKDDFSHLGLVLDKLLDPSIHKMYDDHDSNAAYFFERDPTYREYTAPGKRPIYPWKKSEKKDEPQRKDIPERPQLERDNESFPQVSSNVKNTTKNIPSLLDSIRIQKRPCQTQVTPHATEALAHFYTDLANDIIQEAGGNNNNIMFNNNNFGNLNALTRIHRNLQMSSFLIGMYAVGIHNLTMRNWQTRGQFGYNVGWLHTQALDIGKNALEHVRRTWPRHFTAYEVSTLADKASHRPDQEIIHQGALLAVSALYKAHLLSPNDVNHRLRQCREFSLEVTEEACVVLEKIANENNGFSSQALFQVARYWHELYESNETGVFSLAQPDLQAQYQRLGRASEQYHRYAPYMNNMFYPPGPPPSMHNIHQYPPAPLHPSHSAPNLLPQNQVPYPYNLDSSYSYYSPNIPGNISYNNHYYPSRNPPPPCRSQRSMPTPNHQASSSNSNPVNAALPPQPPQMPNYYQQQPNNANVQNNSNMNIIRPIPAGDNRLIRLLNAYRVGILAIKSQRMAEHDKKVFGDSISAPQYEDDLLWLFGICKMLGSLYVNSFFENVLAFITSPKVLLRFIMEAKSFYKSQQSPNFHINQHPFVEQLPIVPSMGMYSQGPPPPPHPLSMHPHSSSSGNCSATGSGNTSPSSLQLHQINSNYPKSPLQGDMKHIRQTMASYPEQVIRLSQKCIEMCYYGVQHRLNFPKLHNADVNPLRILLGEAKEAFEQIPDGMNRFDCFIRHWKSQKYRQKRPNNNEIRIKDIFDEFTYKNQMDYQSNNYIPGLPNNG